MVEETNRRPPSLKLRRSKPDNQNFRASRRIGISLWLKSKNMSYRAEVYFDTRAYANSDVEFLRADLTSLTIENADLPEQQRITPYELNFDSEGKLPFNLRWETETDKLENQALYMIRDLAKSGKKNILWISPPSEAAGFTESRMVVAILKDKKDDGSLSFECRGLCFKFGSKKCLEIAKKISGYDFLNSEILRGTSLAFNLEDGDKDWIDTLEKKISAPEVWQAIRNGEDFLNKKEKEKLANEVIGVFGERLRNADSLSYRENLLLGSEIEMFLASKGARLQAVGSCGISNTEALKGTFDVIFDSALMPGVRPEGYNYWCPYCHCWCRSGVCDICKQKIYLVA